MALATRADSAKYTCWKRFSGAASMSRAGTNCAAGTPLLRNRRRQLKLFIYLLAARRVACRYRRLSSRRLGSRVFWFSDLGPRLSVCSQPQAAPVAYLLSALDGRPSISDSPCVVVAATLCGRPSSVITIDCRPSSAFFGHHHTRTPPWHQPLTDPANKFTWRPTIRR